MFSWHPRHRDRLWVALLFLGFAVGLYLTVCLVGSWAQLELNGWGYANLSLFSLLILWQLADAIFRPRWIYGLFGFEDLPLTPQIRLWRRMALLALAIVTVADCVILLTEADGRPVPAGAIAPITVLTAAFLAALGWMYTAFEKERIDRATQTLAAAQVQLSGANVLILYNQIAELVLHCIAKHGLGRDQPIPIKAMSTTLGEVPDYTPALGKSSTTLADITIQFLNQCEHISLGVREGLFDFRSIRLLLRQRFLRIAFRFSEFIAQQTNATPEKGGRCRATSLNWEHYLWLVHHLNARGDDKVDTRLIVLPPKASLAKSKAALPAATPAPATPAAQADVPAETGGPGASEPAPLIAQPGTATAAAPAALPKQPPSAQVTTPERARAEAAATPRRTRKPKGSGEKAGA